jgi:hypothetical protein
MSVKCGLTLGEEHRMRLSKNRLSTRTFGPEREEVARDWRRLHNEELHNLYASPSIVRVIKSRRIWVTHGARMGKMRNKFKILSRKIEGKKPLGRTRRRWADNIRIDLRETGWKIVDWTEFDQDRGYWWALVNAVITFQAP